MSAEALACEWGRRAFLAGLCGRRETLTGGAIRAMWFSEVGRTGMFKRFYPDHEVESAYGIDYRELYARGYRGVIFDIDNTLVPHGAPADGKSKELFRSLREMGFGTVLLSNNKEPRVKSFADDVSSNYIFRAGKPGQAGYEKAMELMGTDSGTTLFVGDQLFTDVWGAKKAGIVTYLTKPINPKEEIQIVLKRRLEWIVLFFYHRRKSAGKA